MISGRIDDEDVTNTTEYRKAVKRKTKEIR